MRDGILLVGGVLALWLLSRRSQAATNSQGQRDQAWEKALFTEYHPDAPKDQIKMEGGPNDRMGKPIITVQQHKHNPALYPYVSVASDTRLRGSNVPYGTRIYFGAYPDLVFRIVDTGGRFIGPKKRIRKPGFEPFDIATSYGSKLGYSGKETVYRLDRNDTLTKRPNVA